MKNISKREIDIVRGKIVKKYRLEMGLTQDELAQKLDLSSKYISRIENGISGLGDETLIKYINFLGITPNILYEELITNEDVKKQLEISKQINELSPDKLHFLIKFIALLKDMDNI